MWVQNIVCITTRGPSEGLVDLADVFKGAAPWDKHYVLNWRYRYLHREDTRTVKLEWSVLREYTSV